MNTIALETSTQPGAVALLDDDRVVYEAPLPERRPTTETFAMQLRDGMQAAGWKPAQVDLFAVCEGPGSFTGLRIGIMAAKAFAYATGCQLVAVNTLEVIASRIAMRYGEIWAVLDAQRQQLFVAQYGLQAGQVTELSPTQLVSARDWLAGLPSGTKVTGPGLRRWAELLPDHVNLVPEPLWAVQASQLGRLARQRHACGQTADLWTLIPRYYRPSAAEEKRP
jgi:tRNA threonylcarbamoyladenosine biosynthesis protein TsaB